MSLSHIQTFTFKISAKLSILSICIVSFALISKLPADTMPVVLYMPPTEGTPLVVCVNNKIYGVIYLKDTVKPGLRERFERLRKIGIRTIMCQGTS